MANYHVVPRGDAAEHDTHHAGKCACVPEIRTFTDPDHPSLFDVWHYHRVVSIEEACSSAETPVSSEGAG